MPEFIITMLICTSPDICIPFKDDSMRFTQERCIEIAKDALAMRTGLASGQNEKYKFDVDTTMNGWVLVTVTKTEPDEAWGKWRTLALSPTALVELAIATGLINADLNVEDPLHIVAVAGD